MESLFDTLVAYPVPHEYFTHFYFVSVTSSLLWGYQIVMQGSLVQALGNHGSSEGSSRSMSLEKVALCWSLMAIQGMRRLYETITLHKASGSTMPISHYLLGVSYYVIVGVSIWVEGSGWFARHQLRLTFHSQ